MTGMDERPIDHSRRRAVLGAVAIAFSVALAGCGRRSTAKPPEGSTYNQEYPTRRSMGLPPEAPPPSTSREDEDDAPSADRFRPPLIRY
jgi:hypothetical protein